LLSPLRIWVSRHYQLNSSVPLMISVIALLTLLLPDLHLWIWPAAMGVVSLAFYCWFIIIMHWGTPQKSRDTESFGGGGLLDGNSGIMANNDNTLKLRTESTGLGLLLPSSRRQLAWHHRRALLNKLNKASEAQHEEHLWKCCHVRFCCCSFENRSDLVKFSIRLAALVILRMPLDYCYAVWASYGDVDTAASIIVIAALRIITTLIPVQSGKLVYEHLREIAVVPKIHGKYISTLLLVLLIQVQNIIVNTCLTFINTSSDQKCFAAFIEGLLVNSEMLLVSLAHFRYFSSDDIAGWDPSRKNLLPDIPNISSDLERLEHFPGEGGEGILPAEEWSIRNGIDQKHASEYYSGDITTNQHGVGSLDGGGGLGGGSEDLFVAASGKRESMAQPVL